MKQNINEELGRIKLMMEYNRSKTMTENLQRLSEITGAGATPPPATNTGTPTNTGGNLGGSPSAPAPQIPSELANAEGVKKFQDWLDTNKPGWASGYSGGVVNKGRGYGRFGPRTSAAWNTHKNAYLNPRDPGYQDPTSTYTSTAPTSGSGTPTGASGTPTGASGAPTGASGAPTGASGTPTGASGQPISTVAQDQL